jgi:putative inorganic carbon (HCO3(-)) transporter
VVDSLKSKFVYLVGLLFITVFSYLLYNDSYWYFFAAVPVIFFLIGLALVSLDKLLLFIVFCTPLSFNIESVIDANFGLYLPTEPLMFGAMLLFFIKLLYTRSYDINVAKHPVTIALLINLIWLTITCITSEMPIVSFKFLLSRLWFVVTFYFLATQMFKQKANLLKFVWMYIIPLVIVIFITVIHHSMYGFTVKAGHWVMNPFYKDHTSYGAILAMFFPFIVWQLLKKGQSAPRKITLGLLTIVFIIALILSYTRAAWLSLIFALCVYLAFIFKIKFKTLAAIGIAVVALLFVLQDDIFMKLEKNRQDSSTDLTEHVQSMSNVSTDASNLERINRWSCAVKMFAERPVFGWGPGTYMFQYAPFQHSSHLTIISTNFGNMGNAHSEYLGPLAESGVFGALTFLVLIGLIIYRSSLLYIRLEDEDMKMLVMTLLLGLITYLVHGILNNYLDTDKASVPFWGFTAILVMIDLYHSPKRS